MEYIDIADTGVRASRVGLGAWAIGGWSWGGTQESEAIATIHSVGSQACPPGARCRSNSARSSSKEL